MGFYQFTMNNSPVPNCNPVFQFKNPIGSDMENGILFYGAPRADDDFTIIPPDNGAMTDITIITYGYIANDPCRITDI